MKKYFSLIAVLLLSACTIALNTEHGMNMEHGTVASTRKLSVHDLSTETALSFRIDEAGQAFREYGISHTKEMHLIVVRNDLTHFSHLHPLRNDDDVWSIPFQLKEPGTYWFFADFVDAKNASYTLRFDRKIGDALNVSSIARDAQTTKIIDGYKIEMTPKETKNEVIFTYKILDAQGNVIIPENYLGAKGHSILLSPVGDFVHAHPPENSSNLSFLIERTKDDFYRMFTQFKINGKILTVDFDWNNKK